VNPETPSRFSHDWNPIQDTFAYRSLGSLNQAMEASRSSFDWRGMSGGPSTAEVVANKLGIAVPYWAKQGYDWRQILAPAGMGQTGSPQQISAIASTGASATVGILVAMGTIAGPVGAAIAGVIGVANLLVGVFKGCGQTCIDASNIANQVSAALTTNVQTYVNSPVRTISMQAAALNNFTTAWNALVANCQNPSLGTAGQNCISQRQQGACAYKTTPGGWNQVNGVWSYTWPGANNSGPTCWNYFVGYHDPIANDPDVQPDTVVTSPAAGSSTTSTAITSGDTTSTPTVATAAASPDLTPLLLIGGLIALAVIL
jgi:hypothetical protein